MLILSEEGENALILWSDRGFSSLQMDKSTVFNRKMGYCWQIAIAHF
ncbi:MAG: hypothetical protein AB8B69_09930 [Chitinophagales bacterium]